MTEWVIVVVDTLRIKGKPANWMRGPATLMEAGIPPAVAVRWKRVRREMTADLRHRVKRDRN
jgi:hypothetical protein